MPLTHWPHGTGFVLGFFHILFPESVGAILSARIAAVCLFCVSSITLWLLLDTLELQRKAKVFVFTLFLSGANFGYYFVFVSSEAVTVCAVLIAMWAVLSVRSNTAVSSAVLGGGACMLITGRPQAILAILPVVGIFVFRELRRREGSRSLFLCSIVGAGFLLGALQVIQVNEWMTGSWRHSPLIFGDDTFHSMGWPQFFDRVLLSRRTGILVRTPLVAIAFALSLRLVFQKSLLSEWRIFFGLACLANVANMLITAGFYAWSGGGGMGSRYFVATAVPMFLSIPVMLSPKTVSFVPGKFLYLLAFASIPATFSVGMKEATIIAVTAVAIWACVQKLIGESDGAQWTALSAISAVLLSEFVHRAIQGDVSFSTFPEQASPLIRLVVVTPAVLILTIAALRKFTDVAELTSSSSARRLQLVAMSVCCGVSVFQAAKFAEFRTVSEAYRASQRAKPDVRYKYRATFNIENFSNDVDAGMSEYEYDTIELEKARSFRDKARLQSLISVP